MRRPLLALETADQPTAFFEEIAAWYTISGDKPSITQDSVEAEEAWTGIPKSEARRFVLGSKTVHLDESER